MKKFLILYFSATALLGINHFTYSMKPQPSPYTGIAPAIPKPTPSPYTGIGVQKPTTKK